VRSPTTSYETYASGSPSIDVIGKLEELLRVFGITALLDEGAVTPDEAVLGMFTKSVKDGPRALSRLYRTPVPASKQNR
jgi:hypothetical protein